MDLLCLMFECHPRGYLQTANGKPFSHDQIARMTGCSLDEVDLLIVELETACVFSRTKAGVIFSRRQVRDENSRADHRSRQHKYRKSKKEKGNGDASVTPMSHLSSSSTSSSSSTAEQTPPNPPAPDPPLDHIDIARRVGEECRITSTQVLREIQEQVKLDLAEGRIADDIAAEMVGSIQAYRQETPRLQVTWKLETFIGGGHWRDPTTWPRKEDRNGRAKQEAEWEAFKTNEA